MIQLVRNWPTMRRPGFDPWLGKRSLRHIEQMENSPEDTNEALEQTLPSPCAGGWRGEGRDGAVY